MNGFKIFLLVCVVGTAALYAEEYTGVLGFSNSAKGYYVFGFKGHKNEDPVCTSKYLIPGGKLALIDLVKMLDGRRLKVTYSYQKIKGGGTREYCIVSNIIVIEIPD